MFRKSRGEIRLCVFTNGRGDMRSQMAQENRNVREIFNSAKIVLKLFDVQRLPA